MCELHIIFYFICLPCRRVVGGGIIARLVIGLHVDEASIVVNRVVYKSDICHGVSSSERRLHMQRWTPPTTCVEAMAFVAQTNNVVVYVYVGDPSAGLATNRNPHSDAENVVSDGYVSSSESAVAEACVKA